jgi:hypothetical protein
MAKRVSALFAAGCLNLAISDVHQDEGCLCSGYAEREDNKSGCRTRGDCGNDVGWVGGLRNGCEPGAKEHKARCKEDYDLAGGYDGAEGSVAANVSDLCERSRWGSGNRRGQRRMVTRVPTTGDDVEGCLHSAVGAIDDIARILWIEYEVLRTVVANTCFCHREFLSCCPRRAKWEWPAKPNASACEVRGGEAR